MNPEFSIYTIPATNDAKTNGSILHQKNFVVDGLLAFKGSANLTFSARRKAAEGLDLIEMLTDVEEVAGLNNQFFSPVMARMRRLEELRWVTTPRSWSACSRERYNPFVIRFL